MKRKIVERKRLIKCFLIYFFWFFPRVVIFVIIIVIINIKYKQ